MMKSSLRNSTASASHLSMKTVFLILFVVAVGAGLFVFSFMSSKGNIFINGFLQKFKSPNSVRTDSPPSGEVPYGDENLDTDKQYQEAMRNIIQGTLYNSPFGYTLTLPFGWHIVNRLTLDDRDGQREAFSPYSDKEVDQMLTNDPYNPNYYIEMEIRDNPKNVSLTEWTTKSNYSPQGVGQQNFDTTLAGYPAVKVIGNQGGGYVDYYVKAGNKVFNPGYFYTEDEQWKSPSQLSIRIFEDIISSFTVQN